MYRQTLKSCKVDFQKFWGEPSLKFTRNEVFWIETAQFVLFNPTNGFFAEF